MAPRKNQKSEAKAPPKRTAAPRNAKKDPWSEEQLTTSSKSRLIDADLTALFADLQAWEILDDAEKSELRALLPEHLSYNDDGSLPKDFLRYDNDWRNGLRQFQNDLEQGRYDPEWLRQAAEAMEERAAGKFDKYKDDQYEEFWGQKQKLAYDVLAGDMTNLKLGVLVKAGVYRVGDVWSYTRAFGRSEKVLVEKDVTVTAIDDGNLTFSIPPGQRKYPVAPEIAALTLSDGDEADAEETIQVNPPTGKQPSTEDSQITFTLEAPQAGPQALETRIVQIDGRIKSRPNGNAWKAIRCKRDNQDMGSLWEMREQFYVRQSTKRSQAVDNEGSEDELPRQKRLKARK